MADVLNREQRSRNMAAIRGRNTKPEIFVRSLLHRMGYRYRLHCADLPGKPDIVLPRWGSVIFVNGCFWHYHDCRYGQVVPATRRDFWEEKRRATIKRDKKKHKELRVAGWRVMVVWECELKHPATLETRLERFLKPT